MIADTGLNAFISKSPKISLHDHLDGSVRISTILSHAKELGLALPAESEAGLENWFQETCSQGTLVEYLKSFEVTAAVMQTQDHLRVVAREYVLDCARDGVVYAETRWAPLEHSRLGMSPVEAIAAVSEGIAEGVSISKLDGKEIEVRQILTALRHEENSIQVARLALETRDLGVVGFDLAGPELGFPPSIHSKAIAMLQAENFPITIHAGEADGPSSVVNAIKDGCAKRIGHGIRIAEEISWEDGVPELGSMAKFVREAGVTLEFAPRSNLQTEGSKIFGSLLRDHPFDKLYRAGFAVSVNPDNRLMSNSSITAELFDLVKTFGYTAADLHKFQENALERVFCDQATKSKISGRVSAFTWSLAG